MEVIVLQVFVSLALVVGSLILFTFSVKQRDHEHAGRLALLPLEEEAGASPKTSETDRKRSAKTP